MTKKRENYKSDRPCLACGEARDGYVCWHHVKTRGAGGEDKDSNFMSLCARHHTEVHQIGLSKFAEKYHAVKYWLKRNRWWFDGRRWWEHVDHEN